MSNKTLLKSIGNTPLVKVDLDSNANIYAKLEYTNPGGSVKDRPALFMIEDAEKNGELKPGMSIIDASSGNYGIALSMIGATKGYDVTICVPDKTSKEKQKTIKAYGANLVVHTKDPNDKDPKSYHTRAINLHKNTPNSFMPNQYLNPKNALGHYYSLGPEIWEQTEGKLTHFIAGAGTCGTLCGAGRYLKEKNPDIKVIGVDAANSFRSTHGHPKPYSIEGIGVDLESEILQQTQVDKFIAVPDEKAYEYTRKLAKRGFLAGLSSGAIVYAIEEIEKTLKPDDYVVAIFGDSGRSYLTKAFV